jgi:hypothetical protein
VTPAQAEQLAILIFVLAALNITSLVVLAIRAPLKSGWRGVFVLGAACLALATLWVDPWFVEYAPTWIWPVAIGALPLSAFLLGYAIAKRPRNRRPTAEGH